MYLARIFLLVIALCISGNGMAQMVNIDYDFAFKWLIYKGPNEDMGAACGDEPTTRLHLYDDQGVPTGEYNCVTVYNNGCGATGTDMCYNETIEDDGTGEVPFGAYLHKSNSPTKFVKMRWEYYEDDWGSRCEYNTAAVVGDDYHVLKNYEWQIRGLTKHSLLVNFGAGTYHQSEYTDGWAISTDWFANEMRQLGSTNRLFTWTGSSGPDQFNGINGKPWHKRACMRVKYRWNYTGNESEIKPCNGTTTVAWTADYPSWSFKAVAGNQYTFSVNVTTLSGINMLRIIHPDGHTELKNTYNGTCQSGCPSSLTFTTPTTGTYYVDVVNRSDYVDITNNDRFGASNNEGVLDPKPVPNGNLTFRLLTGGSPEVTLTTNNTQICPTGGSAVLTAQTSATAYVWFKDNVQFANTLNTYTATQPGTYRVNVQTSGGCSLPSNEVVIAHIASTPPAPVVTLHRNGTGPILLGQELTYTTQVIGSGGRTINYDWYDNTIDALDSLNGFPYYYPTPNVNTIFYTFRARPNHRIGGGIGMYATSAGAGAACFPNYETAYSDTLRLNTIIPSVTISADNEYFCVGEGAVVTLTAEAVNAGSNPHYLWVMDGVEIPGATSPTYTTAPGVLDNLLPGDNPHSFTVYVRPTRPACYSCLIDETFDQVYDFKYIYHRQSSASAFSVNACESYTVPSGDETYTSSGVYMDTIPNYLGCDSVMTITVNITCNVWDGSASTAWGTAANWSLGHVPFWYEDVVIRGTVTNQPRLALDGTLPVEVGNLFLYNNPILTLNMGAHIPSNNEVIELVRQNYSNPFTGAFTNLQHGGQVDIDGFTYAISYTGNTGNDLAITYDGCTLVYWYQDSDNDGFGSNVVFQQACDQPIGYVSNNTDCDDTNGAIGSLRTWWHDADADGLGSLVIWTQDCAQPFPYVANSSDCNDANNAIGVASTVFYPDADGDGFGVPGTTVVACTAPLGYAATNNDCNDANAAINPNTSWYEDGDDDGFGNPFVSSISCTQPSGYVSNDEDCNDGNALINPNLLWYEDADNDGFGDATSILAQCTQPSGYVANDTDCDDSDNGIGALSTWHIDADADGFGNAAIYLSSCSQPLGYVSNDDDCDDSNSAITVQQQWYADNDGDGFGDANYGTYFGCYQLGFSSIDNDCNNQNAALNPNTIWYEDADGDGFGNPNVTLTGCDVGSGYVLLADDCNDTDIAINPSAEEICENGIDDNCDGNIDENCCGTPTNLTATAITGVTATVSWTPVSGASSYHVRYRAIGATNWISNTVTAPASSRAYSSLSGVTSYEWQVRANCGFWSGWSELQQFTTICQIPVNLSVGPIYHNQATLKWSAVPGAVKYQTQYRALGTTTWTVNIVNSPAVSKWIGALAPLTTYEWRVRSNCGDAWGDYTAIASFTTTAICGPPTVLSTTNITTTSARLKWNTVAGSANYRCRYRIVGTSTWVTATTTEQFRSVNGLAASTTYEWQVQSKCGTSYGLWTSSVQFTTLGLSPRLSDQSNTPWAFSIHPNPSNGRFTVTPLADVEGLATVQLVDIAGRVVLNQTWSASEDATLILDKQLDLGLYVLTIIAADGQQFSSRVVIAN